MARLLFWNVQKHASADIIAQIASSNHADVIALAEAGHLEDAVLTRSLWTHSQQTFRRAVGAFRIRVYSSLPEDYIQVRADANGLVLISLRQVFAPDLLIAFAHLPSKMTTDFLGLATLATRLRAAIEDAENIVRHSRTIIMGDLNMEPHEVGLLSSEALHATMCMRIARGRSRTVHGEERRFFYNPMWNLLGDQTRGPPGTYYRSTNDPDAQFWHMIDQVLLRPDVIDLVDIDSLAIITRSDEVALARRNGRPNSRHSDHFPIFIETRDQPEQRERS